jgi:TRAP-type mannitol/chloroaromatic compound transport system permease small subunit
VIASWSIRETSAENNGLPFVYLLKTLMLVMPATLLLQGLAQTLKNGLLLLQPPLVEVVVGQSAPESNGGSAL